MDWNSVWILKNTLWIRKTVSLLYCKVSSQPLLQFSFVPLTCYLSSPWVELPDFILNNNCLTIKKRFSPAQR